MFYYPNVLQRHSGCFSTIWLAATKGVKITRRELLRVNVRVTCQDILNYITAQVPPPQQSLPKPRFSLYLSSQLQYGVVVVYHRQCSVLLDEIQQAIDRLLRSKRRVPIDVPGSDRLALDLPDNLFMMEQAEGAQDPFFGLMASHQLPSPYKQVIRKSGFSRSATNRTVNQTTPCCYNCSPLTQFGKFVSCLSQHFEGADLPEATNVELDLLMDEQDQFRQGAFCFDISKFKDWALNICFYQTIQMYISLFLDTHVNYATDTYSASGKYSQRFTFFTFCHVYNHKRKDFILNFLLNVHTQVTDNCEVKAK
uniref:Rad21/Rec8-like protein N-terminal domain-containing protein n=1 Tax=Neogobius melanostomus TaxID=47308 RepID=A0A8C6TBV9_9GOBI